jgi:hypothetical protein
MTPEEMLEARTAEDKRRLAICDEIETLIAGVREQHPKVPIQGLARHLPEPQRSRLVELLEASREWIP